MVLSMTNKIIPSSIITFEFNHYCYFILSGVKEYVYYYNYNNR
jgi:hypothetical protein